MTGYEEPFGHHKGSFMLPLAVASLFLSTGGVLLCDPLLTISKNDHGRISIYFPVYAYLFLFNPLNFHLNMLLLYVYAIKHTRTPEAPISVLLMKYLPPTARTVLFATLLLSAPLSVHAAVVEESLGLAIGASLVCLALIAILTSLFKKLLISHTSRGIIPVALFALCFSVGFFTLLFSENYHIGTITNTVPLHLLLLFGSFFLFMLGITQLFLRSGIPADVHPAENCVEHWIIVAQSAAIATLLVVGYLKVYATVSDRAAIVIEAVEL